MNKNYRGRRSDQRNFLADLGNLRLLTNGGKLPHLGRVLRQFAHPNAGSVVRVANCRPAALAQRSRMNMSTEST